METDDNNEIYPVSDSHEDLQQNNFYTLLFIALDGFEKI